MDCEKFKNTIDEYLDGILSGKELSEFQGHLSVCSACRQEVEELQSMLSWLKQASHVTPPNDLRKSVLAELKEQGRNRRRFFPGFSQAIAAAVLIMLVVGNLYLLLPSPISDSVPMRAAYQEESGAATPAEDAANYTLEASDNRQVNEKNELSTGARRNPFPSRLVLNLVLVPLFLFFFLRALQKSKEAS